MLLASWVLLCDTSWYSPKTVSLIVNACFLLHNLIRKEGGVDVFEAAYVPPVGNGVDDEANDAAISSVETSSEWTEFRINMANEMWANRGNRTNNP